MRAAFLGYYLRRHAELPRPEQAEAVVTELVQDEDRAPRRWSRRTSNLVAQEVLRRIDDSAPVLVDGVAEPPRTFNVLDDRPELILDANARRAEPSAGYEVALEVVDPGMGR